MDSLDESNSRLLAICNDAAVSADGKRIYFTESYVADGARRLVRTWLSRRSVSSGAVDAASDSRDRSSKLSRG